MAAVPATMAEGGRRSSSSSAKRPNMSHGRGGAGNILPPSESVLTATDLETPTLKTDVYTTGRGGSGNMARNDDPAAARRAQDVSAPEKRRSIEGAVAHVGRGGGGNVAKVGADGHEEEIRRWEDRGTDREDVRGLAERGKDWLMGKKH